MKTTGRLSRALPWLVLAAALAFSIGVFARSGRQNLDSDMASEMVLAQLLNEEGRLLTDSWYYSTELRVLSPVPLYQLGLLLFDSWHAARMLAMAATLLLFSASTVYLTRAMGLGDAGVYAAAALVLPLSHFYTMLMVYGIYYTPFVAAAFAMLGLTLRLPRKRGRLVRLILLAALSFWGGLLGVRLLMQCAVPLALAATLLMIDRARRCDTIREAAATPQAAMFAGAALAGAFMLAGFMVNRVVLTARFDYRDFSRFGLSDFSLSSVLWQIDSVVSYLGFIEGEAMISLGGAANMAAIAVTILIGAALWAVLTGRVKCETGGVFVAMFAGCGLAAGMIIVSLTTGGAGYYMTALASAVICAFLLLEKLPCRLPPLRAALLLGLSAVFLLEGLTYVRNEVRVGEANYEEVADWLVDNGYTQGFATFWNGNVLTEASDGALEMYVFDNWGQDVLFEWLQSKEHITNLPEGEVFVFVEGREDALGLTSLSQEDHLVADLTGGRVYAYASGEEVMRIQREGVASRTEEENRLAGVLLPQ